MSFFSILGVFWSHVKNRFAMCFYSRFRTWSSAPNSQFCPTITFPWWSFLRLFEIWSFFQYCFFEPFSNRSVIFFVSCLWRFLHIEVQPHNTLFLTICVCKMTIFATFQNLERFKNMFFFEPYFAGDTDCYVLLESFLALWSPFPNWKAAFRFL